MLSPPMDFPVGLRFNPTEEELLSYYLKNKILDHPLSEYESQFVIDIDMYGDNATPWELFDPEFNNHDQFIPWFPLVDPSNKVKPFEEILYVYTKLSNVGKTDKSENKQKNRVAGCGTWHGNTKTEPVTVADKNGDPIVIGYRRNFTFRSSTHETVGQWNMTEYNIREKAHGIKFNCDDYVLCKIKRDHSKSSLGGKVIKKKRNHSAIQSRYKQSPSTSSFPSSAKRSKISDDQRLNSVSESPLTLMENNLLLGSTTVKEEFQETMPNLVENVDCSIYLTNNFTNLLQGKEEEIWKAEQCTDVDFLFQQGNEEPVLEPNLFGDMDQLLDQIRNFG